jgi:coproporphyrinogen III oxidase-like Fe-S oxidoreductase
MIMYFHGSQYSFTIIVGGCNWTIEKSIYSLDDAIWSLYDRVGKHRLSLYMQACRSQILDAVELLNSNKDYAGMSPKEFLSKILDG